MVLRIRISGSALLVRELVLRDLGAPSGSTWAYIGLYGAWQRKWKLLLEDDNQSLGNGKKRMQTTT